MNAPGSAGAAKAVSLDQVSPPRLFFALLHQRFTGTMTLEQPEPNAGSRTLWFDGGMPVFTDWLEPTDVLGQVLMELGMIGQEQLFAALGVMANGGGLLGQVLLNQGLLDPAGLAEGLRKQCFRKLVHLFGLRTGQVSVAPANHDLRQLAKVNVLELIGIGVGAHYDVARIEAELGPTMREPIQATAALNRYRTHFRFRPTDEPMLQAMAAGTTFEQLTAAGAPALRVAQLIYSLWACQMLRTGVAAEQATAHPAQPRPAPAARPAPPKPATPKAAPPPQPAAPKPAPPKPAPPKPAPAATPKPATATSAPVGEDEDQFLSELVKFENKLERKANAFGLLGVELTAGRKEIRRAWGDLSKRLHPDGLQSRGLGHLRERVSNVFAALSEAHGLLNDKEKREELRVAIESGEDPADRAEAAATARAAFESELIAKEGDKLLKAGRFDQALDRYQKALELTPTENDLKAASAWCRYNLSDRSRQVQTKEERELAEIVQETPRLARAHYFRGLILKDMGTIEAALISFQEALTNDSRLIDAERQARALRIAKGRPASNEPEPKKRRGLKGLFGKR